MGKKLIRENFSEKIFQIKEIMLRLAKDRRFWIGLLVISILFNNYHMAQLRRTRRLEANIAVEQALRFFQDVSATGEFLIRLADNPQDEEMQGSLLAYGEIVRRAGAIPGRNWLLLDGLEELTKSTILLSQQIDKTLSEHVRSDHYKKYSEEELALLQKIGENWKQSYNEFFFLLQYFREKENKPIFSILKPAPGSLSFYHYLESSDLPDKIYAIAEQNEKILSQAEFSYKQ